MKNQFNLNIKTPCQENFNNFSPTTEGGFCESCDTEVIDFTTMSADQIINYLKTKATDTTCGRFNSNQLKTYDAIPKKRQYLSVLSGIGLACFSLLSLTTAQAQDTKTGEVTAKSNIKQSQNLVQVKGVVLDQDNLPLPSATILLEGTSIGTNTDFDGNFEFPEKLKKGAVLVFSYIGYASKKVKIDNESSNPTLVLNVNMTDHDIILMGKIATNDVYRSKRKK